VPEPVTIIGSFLSPYVRKVLVALDCKGIVYEIDPIVPFYGDERFSALSPLRRIPVLIDGDLVLSDSSVICQYLEDRHPEPALYPRDVADRARARRLEEFADTRMGDVLIWRLFNERVIRPFVWGEKTDEALVARTLAEDVPLILDYLESLAPADGFFFGEISIADVSVAAFFRNANIAQFQIDAARWPKTAALVARAYASPPFQRLAVIENRILRTPPAEQREALAALGVRLTTESLGTEKPRKGVMSV
jgi:glutathione S-transferase